jgi:cation diffusion facilitator family transporter
LLLALSIALFSLKIFGWVITDSNALLSDALETIANISAALFGLVSLRLALKPKDEDHPYGHGKIEFVAAIFEGTLITISGLLILIKVIYNFFVPEVPENLVQGLLIAGVAGTLNGVAGFAAWREGRRVRSATLEAAGLHLLSDTLSTAGVLLGLGLAYATQWLILDNITALIFGLLLVGMGIRLVWRNVHHIMDKVDPELLKSLTHFLNENRRHDWVDIHNLRLIKYGADIHVDCHITVPYYYSLQQAHDLSENFSHQITHHFGSNTEAFVHLDPCLPEMCRFCLHAQCPARSFPFEKKLKWTPELLQRNQKHHHPKC